MVNLHPRATSGRPRTPEETRGEADWIPTNFNSFTDADSFPLVGRLQGWRDADLQNLEGRDDSPQSQTDAVALLHLQYFTLFFFFFLPSLLFCMSLDQSQQNRSRRFLLVLPLRLAKTNVCVSLLWHFQKCRGCSWGDVTHVAHPSSVREERCTNRTTVHPPNPRTFSRALFFFTHKKHFSKKLRWSFARTHEDGRSRQIGAENQPFHPTAREI